MGADFLAISFDGSKHLKVQLKGRLTFEKKYTGKEIYICFHDSKNEKWYLYDHDEMLDKFIKKIEKTLSWSESGGYSYSQLSKESRKNLEVCILG